MEYCLRSHVGRVRSNNEDFIEHFSICKNAHIFVVSDGMGGHNKGEVASKIATHTVVSLMEKAKHKISESILSGKLQDTMGILVDAVKQANQVVYEEGEKEEFFGMGTTMVTALVAEDRLLIANVGDSRCYLIRDGRIRQLTKDNSFVQELVESGVITEEEAVNHSKKNIITRAIGTDCYLKVDTYEFELEKEDFIILCSDGLTNMIRDEEILSISSSDYNLEEKTDKLVEKALEYGGLDNISIILIKYDGKVGVEDDK